MAVLIPVQRRRWQFLGITKQLEAIVSKVDKMRPETEFESQGLLQEQSQHEECMGMRCGSVTEKTGSALCLKDDCVAAEQSKGPLCRTVKRDDLTVKENFDFRALELVQMNLDLESWLWERWVLWPRVLHG